MDGWVVVGVVVCVCVCVCWGEGGGAAGRRRRLADGRRGGGRMDRGGGGGGRAGEQGADSTSATVWIGFNRVTPSLAPLVAAPPHSVAAICAACVLAYGLAKQNQQRWETKQRLCSPDNQSSVWKWPWQNQ